MFSLLLLKKYAHLKKKSLGQNLYFDNQGVYIILRI